MQGIENVLSDLRRIDNEQQVSLVALRIVLNSIYSELSEAQKNKIAESMKEAFKPTDENNTHESKRLFELARTDAEKILGVQL